MDGNAISKMLQETDFLQDLKVNKSKKREPVTMYLDNEAVEGLDFVTKVLNNNTEEAISKSLILENAIKEYIARFKVSESMSRFIKNEDSIDHLCIIFTSKSNSPLYKERFLGITKEGKQIRKRWSAVALGAETVKLINSKVIRFISLYKGLPEQGCEEYAEIDCIELIDADNLCNEDPTENEGDVGKYRIYLKGQIQTLPRKVGLGTAVASSIMRGKKATLRNLLTKPTIDQL